MHFRVAWEAVIFARQLALRLHQSFLKLQYFFFVCLLLTSKELCHEINKN